MGRWWENREALSHRGVGSHSGILNLSRAVLQPEIPSTVTASGCFKASLEVAARPRAPALPEHPPVPGATEQSPVGQGSSWSMWLGAEGVKPKIC